MSDELPKIAPTQVGTKRVQGITEAHHLQVVLAESHRVPCECAEWHDGGIDELSEDRVFIGFRNWTALMDCKKCDATASVPVKKARKWKQK